MLEGKFDKVSLLELGKKFDEIQNWASMQRHYEHRLYYMIDNLSRVVGMYNDILLQLLDDGKIETSAPLSYIESKFSTVYDIYQRMSKDKTFLK